MGLDVIIHLLGGISCFLALSTGAERPAKTHPPYQPCPQWDDRHMLGVRKTGMSKGIRH